ncbi:nitroreductase family protein [Kibdelosporangium persicum]|uniref:Nitroreductase n=1 Tax=Kibdelosporangium persicum TaxID=2698649 RepID=A0ABX2FDI9_9PSEU|nr:nitroreductase family protein [Kibdelosporangium persicum]NRN68926.1 Nitroreductase [Kibdelosporangium persicum]
MELHDAIRGSRPVRKFKPTPVPRELMAQVMAQTAGGPTCGDDIQHEFVVTRGAARARIQEAVIDDIEVIRRVCGTRPADFYLDFGGAPVLVFAYAGKLPDGRDDTLSVGMALQNMFLGAHAAGLATAWAALPPGNSTARGAGFADNGKTLVGIVPVGFPDEAPALGARDDGHVRWIGY